jgi:hypothetical protein
MPKKSALHQDVQVYWPSVTTVTQLNSARHKDFELKGVSTEK